MCVWVGEPSVEPCRPCRAKENVVTARSCGLTLRVFNI